MLILDPFHTDCLVAIQRIFKLVFNNINFFCEYPMIYIDVFSGVICFVPSEFWHWIFFLI